MMFFFLVKGENDLLQPRKSIATCRVQSARDPNQKVPQPMNKHDLGLRDKTNAVPPEKVRWNDSGRDQRTHACCRGCMS